MTVRLVSDNEKPKRVAEHGLFECHVCRADTGYAGNTFMQVKSKPLLKGGKPVGGVKSLACVDCLSRGKVTLF